MKKFKIYLIFIMIIGMFFANTINIEAKDSLKGTLANLSINNGCSNYFSLKSNATLYQHGNNYNGAGALYDHGVLNSKIYVNGNSKGSKETASTDDKSITTAWYFLANKRKKINQNAKLIIDAYSGSEKICTATITGFSDQTNNVKVALAHVKKESNLKLVGTFSNGGNNAKSEVELKIEKKETTTELNTEQGTKKASGTKQQFLATDKDGNIVVDNSKNSKNACKTITGIIDEYWGYVMVIVPILLIVVMTLDFFKALGSGKDEDIKKAGNNTVKRVIAAVILLALPALLTMIFDWFGIDICI